MNDSLLARIKNCPNLPTLPSIAVQVLDLAKNDHSDIAEIARLITKDAALSGKILKTVNSSFYGRSSHISTISHALVIMGLQTVKSLTLGFSLVSKLKPQPASGFDHLAYWKRSIYAATAARLLAVRAKVAEQEEAFLAGLLMDVGMLVLDTALGDAYSDVFASVTSHAQLSVAEQKALGGTHCEVGGVIAELWKLPDCLAKPIECHENVRHVDDEKLQLLVDIVRVAGKCADLYVAPGGATNMDELRRQCADLCHCPEAEIDTMLGEIGTRTREVASLFEINLGQPVDFDTILKRANETLSELTLKTQMQAVELRQQNSQLKHAACTDGLTGLANRARFDQFLAEQFVLSKQTGQPLSLLLLDVDKFKSINDKYGHPMGDQVIKSVAKIVQLAGRRQDVCARFGGEEMCLILPDTSRQVASAVAESVRRGVAAHPVRVATTSIAVTVSVGVATFEAGSPFRSVEHLLKAADLSVYAAKEAGRNRVRVFTLGGKAAA